MTNRRVALVTCRAFADLEADDRLVVPELAARGVAAVPVIWDDPSADWDSYDLAIVRSTWDYVDRRDEFLAWAASVPRLANPAGVLRWNTDKRYLRDLADAGAPVVPTTWFGPGDVIELPSNGVVVAKPSIGAGSRDAGRFDLGQAADRKLATKHVQRLLDRGMTVLLQPYLDAVDTAGETAVVYLGGEFSHAIRKAALLQGADTEVDGLYREEKITSSEPSDDERAAAESILRTAASLVPHPLLYARVDLIPDADGRPVLLELELSEPSLFMQHAAGAASRFSASVGTHLDRVLKTG